MSLKKDAYEIIETTIEAALPHSAVKKALKDQNFSKGRLILVSIGKAAWSMAKAASDILGSRIETGIVITKYDHSQGDIENLEIFEAGHPISDANTYLATDRVINLVSHLKEEDTVLFLISGGGSALFEAPLVDINEIKDINNQLLVCGANIVEINTIRKRLSKVKGGKFSKICEPANVVSVVLSDIIGDPLDMIASGPAFPDSSTTEDALRIVDKYNLRLSHEAMALLKIDTPSIIENTKTMVTGSVNQLCEAARQKALELGYKPIVLTSSLDCEAREAGKFMGAIGRYHRDSKNSLCFIAGGETVVQIKGKGKGGRNQELALAAANEIKGIDNIVIFSFGSDGTDGPTDAAGGVVDGNSEKELKNRGIDIYNILENNDSYNALKEIDGLIMTGPTGTNVNDLSVLLIKRK